MTTPKKHANHSPAGGKEPDGRFILKFENREIGSRKPRQVWEFDRMIRNWTEDSARSQILVR